MLRKTSIQKTRNCKTNEMTKNVYCANKSVMNILLLMKKNRNILLIQLYIGITQS